MSNSQMSQQDLMIKHGLAVSDIKQMSLLNKTLKLIPPTTLLTDKPYCCSRKGFHSVIGQQTDDPLLVHKLKASSNVVSRRSSLAVSKLMKTAEDTHSELPAKYKFASSNRAFFAKRRSKLKSQQAGRIRKKDSVASV